MTPSDIIQIVSTLGFPIVACAALFWYMVQQQTKHKEESDSLAAALNNNTLALTKLAEKMDK